MVDGKTDRMSSSLTPTYHEKPRVIVLRTAGTNCDQETVFAFRHFGAEVDLVHINALFAGTVRLKDYQILAVPGGFTYGDDIMSGRILANELRLRLGEDLGRFIEEKKLMIGICNGFQVFVRAGILPGPRGSFSGLGRNGNRGFTQNVTLTYNDSGKFEDRWTYLKVGGKSVWTENLDDIVYFPVAHAEGKFMPRDTEVLRRLEDNGQIAFRYCRPDGQAPGYPENPNGSIDHVAGITDRTGRILGMMPHPERHFFNIQHPRWTGLGGALGCGTGAKIFENGVRYAREHLL